jgi:hypothetical protein
VAVCIVEPRRKGTCFAGFLGADAPLERALVSPAEGVSFCGCSGEN